jgi:aryl-alcohol dehydrogenase (NADP+)
MRYVTLGRTGLQVSRLCLGMMSMGAPQWRPWVLGEAEARPVVRRAVELGVNFIDTADTYSAESRRSSSASWCASLAIATRW